MGAFKLGKMTFGSLFKKPETVMYPLETKPQPAGLKGHIVIDVDRCIVCGMCDRSCSTDCIKVDRKARTWEIDPFACVQCGYCVTVCPKDCLVMDPNYFPVAVEKASVVFEIPEQDKPAKAKPEQAKPEQAKPEKVSSEQAKVPESKAEGDQSPAKSADPEPARDRDEQVEALLTIMDAEKAERVKSALAK